MGSLKEGRGQSEPTKVSRLRWSSRSQMKLKPAGDEAEEDDVGEAEPAGDEAEEDDVEVKDQKDREGLG